LVFIYIMVLFTSSALAATEATGGWQVVSVGESDSQGQSLICNGGGDPSIVLGIVSASSLYGPGSVSDEKSGKIEMTIPVGGYELYAGFDGDVRSSLKLDSVGTGSTAAYIEAGATGISIGGDGYDIFGSADLITKGYIVGKGVGESQANGSSIYKVITTGVSAEVWGEVTGESSLRVEGFNTDSVASSGGAENGLHTDSRVRKEIGGDEISSSSSTITSYGSVINGAKVSASSLGTAQSGAWDSRNGPIHMKLQNEDVASSVTGNVWGYAESNGYLDAADVSAILKATASKGTDLYVLGGPASYAASAQSSSAERTYAETSVEDASWGSVARDGDGDGDMAVQWGNLDDLKSLAHTYGPDASAISFGKILMTAEYYVNGSQKEATGYTTLETYAETTKGKVAFASTLIGPGGDGTVRSEDSDMYNIIDFVGGLYHFSSIESAVPRAETHNVVGRLSVITDPLGSESIAQPFGLSTATDPNYAWSRTEASFRNSHA
jgi:hypothetical protein